MSVREQDKAPTISQGAYTRRRVVWAACVITGALAAGVSSGCTKPFADGFTAAHGSAGDDTTTAVITDAVPCKKDDAVVSSESAAPSEDELRQRLDMVEDFRDEFNHGPKGAEFQRYIVLHDTEGGASPEGVVDYWDSTDNGVAAHFVIGKNGHMVQCVALDNIAHHAGFGDTGHNELYGTTDESRDDKAGTTPIGSWASDYGMNSYSVGIEMVHVGGEGDYPIEQLEALDNLIAYIDAHYGGVESQIIDHKAWRTGNSDTSAEFAGYLANYQDHRTHN